MLQGLGVCITLFRTHVADDGHMTPAIMLSAVGAATTAVVGGLICNDAYAISPRLAVPVIIVGYFLGGWAIWLAVILYGIHFHKLLVVGWPPPERVPGLVLLVSSHFDQAIESTFPRH